MVVIIDCGHTLCATCLSAICILRIGAMGWIVLALYMVGDSELMMDCIIAYIISSSQHVVVLMVCNGFHFPFGSIYHLLLFMKQIF